MCGEIYCKDCRHKCKEDVTDREVELLWEELEDIPVYENENYELCLEVDFEGWNKGTTQSEIWNWFNKHHSKGITYLVNEYEPE